MTAIVGILNRHGIAFAADSAATHSLAEDKKKISNHANKIFELSKYHPIGVAICGGLSFMGLPWEDVVKLYRVKLDKGSFPHVEDYVKDFMQFVRQTILPHYTEEQKGHLRLLSDGLRNEAINLAKEKLIEGGRDLESIKSSDIFPLLCDKLSEFIRIYGKEEMKCGKDFEGYGYEDFNQYAGEVVRETIKDLCSDDQCPDGFEEIFSQALYHILVSKFHVYMGTTELIFWGYGEDDFFPSCHSIKISAAFDGRIRWTDNSVFVVMNSSPAWIVPFAQTDVSNTVVRGVDQILREQFSKEAGVVLVKFKIDLANKLEEIGAPGELKDAIIALDMKPYEDLFTDDMNKYIQENYIDKLMETVSFLMKEDLAEMAESLVKMTCLKRHFTTDEETVGGPVDVAVATRGDGFVWIKRKHYFDASINHHYFER